MCPSFSVSAGGKRLEKWSIGRRFVEWFLSTSQTTSKPFFCMEAFLKDFTILTLLKMPNGTPGFGSNSLVSLYMTLWSYNLWIGHCIATCMIKLSLASSYRLRHDIFVNVDKISILLLLYYYFLTQLQQHKRHYFCHAFIRSHVSINTLSCLIGDTCLLFDKSIFLDFFHLDW